MLNKMNMFYKKKDNPYDSKNNTFEIFIDSYQKQIDALKANQINVDEKAVQAATKIILSCKGKLVLTGIGKSGLIAQKLSATFSSTGTPAFFLHPSESLHGDLGVLQKGDVLMLLAKSGESEEVVAMLDVVRKLGNPIISILGNADSTVGRMSEVVIKATVEREADNLDLAPTASTTVALVVGDSIASAVSAKKNFKPENFALYHPAGQLGRRLHLKVEDLLFNERGVPIVNENASMIELLDAESKPNLGGVMIVNSFGKLIGLVTDGDIRRSLMKHKNVLTCKITEIMTKDPQFVLVGTKAFEALKLMEERLSQINVLPVLDKSKKPVGLLRIHDLINARI